MSFAVAFSPIGYFRSACECIRAEYPRTVGIMTSNVGRKLCNIDTYYVTEQRPLFLAATGCPGTAAGGLSKYDVFEWWLRRTVRVAVLLVSNRRNRISADGRMVDGAVTFLVDLADEDNHITLDKVKPERYLLNTLVKAVHTLF